MTVCRNVVCESMSLKVRSHWIRYVALCSTQRNAAQRSATIRNATHATHRNATGVNKSLVSVANCSRRPVDWLWLRMHVLRRRFSCDEQRRIWSTTNADQGAESRQWKMWPCHWGKVGNGNGKCCAWSQQLWTFSIKVRTTNAYLFLKYWFKSGIQFFTNVFEQTRFAEPNGVLQAA